MLQPTDPGRRVALQIVCVSILTVLSSSASAAPPTDVATTPVVENSTGEETEPDLPQIEGLPVTKPPSSREEAVRRFESALTKLGTIGASAREGGEIELLDCIRDKQSRAANVADLFDSEQDVLDSATATDEQKAFALEKLSETTLQMEQLYGLGRICVGDLGPEDQVNQTRNRAQEPRLIPLLDPTLGLGASRVPTALPVDWLPTASPTE